MNIAIVPAGGAGERIKSKLPKQFMELRGKPLIIHTLIKLNAHDEIDRIIIGCKEGYADLLRDMADRWGIDKLDLITPGGKSRRETVFNCLKASKAADNDIILIHDAARPFLTDDVIQRSISAAKEHGAATAAIAATDTIARSSDGYYINDIPKRSELYHLQTPQTFLYGVIYKAHLCAGENGMENASDDCGLCLAAGEKVFIIEGSARNIKITRPEDARLMNGYSQI